jgi:hypothetical protein
MDVLGPAFAHLRHQVEHRRRENVDAEVAQVVPGTQARHEQLLLGGGRGRLLQDVLDLVQVGPPLDVEVVADEVQERLPEGEGPAQREGVPVPVRRVLGLKVEPGRVLPRSGPVGVLFAGRDDKADLLDAG